MTTLIINPNKTKQANQKRTISNPKENTSGKCESVSDIGTRPAMATLMINPNKTEQANPKRTKFIGEQMFHGDVFQ